MNKLFEQFTTTDLESYDATQEKQYDIKPLDEKIDLSKFNISMSWPFDEYSFLRNNLPSCD